MTDDTEDFAALLAEFEGKQTRNKRAPQPGELVKGRIVSIGQDAVFVDLGSKAEGIIDLVEVRDAEGTLTVSVGDEIEARVVETGSSIVLRKTLGRGPEAKAELEQAFQLGVPVEGVVTGVNKGGVEVQIAGTRAFCPISQLDARHVEDASAYVGQRLSFRITKYEAGRRDMNLVLSRRVLLEEEAHKRAEETRAKLAVGAVLRGTITTLKDYGAFVDLGGLEGMLHISEIGFARVAHPRDALSVGQTVDVQVLKIEKSGDPRRPEKISLSLRSLEKDPWQDLGDRYPEGTRVVGTVARVEPFGAFVEIAPGVEGLLPIGELSAGRKVAHARQLVKPGARLEVVVGQVDRERRRLPLGLAGAVEEPDEGAPPPAASAKQGFGTLGDLLKKKEPKK
jgi:small subunit ribosomal protein S1